MYSPNYYYPTANAVAGLEVLAIVLLVLGALVGTACVVLQVIGMWKTFKKAGLKGWEAIVPFYNTFTLVRVAGLELWWFVVILVTAVLSTVGVSYDSLGFNVDANWGVVIVALFLSLAVNYKVAQSFGKSKGFAVGLTLLPFAFWLALGLSKDKYKGPAGPYVVKPLTAKGK
jgi:hypothetical protein